MNGVEVGVGVSPKGRGVGIGAKMSGEIVGGTPPSAFPAHATTVASKRDPTTTAICLENDFMRDAF